MGAVADPPGTHVDPEQLTVVYTPNEDGWITAQIREFPAAISQGPTEHEAWRNVLDALHDLTHEPTATERLIYTIQAQADRVAELAEQLTEQLGPLVVRTGRSVADAWERYQRTRVP
jgi:predicted RNase H-like HicB family nuclease